MTNTNFTPLEEQVLTALIDNLYAEPGFSDVDAKDIAHATKLDTKTIRGVLSSLVKKEAISIEETDTWGVPKSQQYQIIYLREAYYHLHPRWSKEEA